MTMQILSTQAWVGLLVVAAIAVRSYRRESLTPWGCIVALCTGSFYALHPNRPLILLLAFFLTGTKLTSWGHDLKHELLMDPAASKQPDAPKKKGRTSMQVLCNSAPATILLAIHSITTVTHREPALTASLNDLLMVGVIAQYGCSAGDTFASEIGVLNDDWPLLITTLQKVPPGTNGGVSLLGVLASLMGGGVIGVAALLMPAHSVYTRMGYFCIAVASGFFGSLFDSILGATMQRTVYDQEMKKVLEAHGGTSVQVKADTEDKLIIIGSDILDNNQQ
ncbi:integral membrane protein DUF92-domain-containing protein [Protomyces lactucae-debilis]|uniref:Integral membrane protein DUF92-domain-containing protein n=1 Tax=Protomyces lactucae-debilis TaxID=2754530 RepID=A0A1Y2FTN3_PROLT|nr:integral membrane protein DUF92-domain-containing protein [Protomyces lactucae-debilis]ORY86937.1 integral membrane protein DUF92-domain-containing protein [Protomyces lactucae-debilis]